MAVGGAVCLPADGWNKCSRFFAGRRDNASGGSGLLWNCLPGSNPQPFSSMIRFEAKKSGEPVAFRLLLESCLDLADAQQLGIVMIAESAGLVGAALRRSPVKADSETNAFEFPRIREWLSFTAERAHTKSVVLVVGIAVRGNAEALAPVIRPFPNPSGLRCSGHFHAAAFSYRPVQRGQIDLKASIKKLFEGQTLEGILHVLSDDRVLSGSGQTELVRGACWLAPISLITVEEGTGMGLLIGALTLGFIFSLVALGVFISFRIFAFPDITADGSSTLGAALAAMLLVKNVNPAIATAAAFVGGFLAGALTGTLATRFKINGLLAGILVMTGLYSVNLHIMGRSNISVLGSSTLSTYADRVAMAVTHNSSLSVIGWEITSLEASLLVASFAFIVLAGVSCTSFSRPILERQCEPRATTTR